MPHNNMDQPEARVLEEEPGYGDTQRLLNSNRSGVRALEVSHRRHEYHYELPPLAARLPAAAALLAVCTCTALLVFGPSDGFFSRDAHVQRLPPACQSAVAGFFWDALVPRHYNFSLRLRPHHFQWQPTTTATPGSDEPQLDSFDASVTIVFEVLQPTSCILLHASGMQFLHASLAVPLDSASPQQAQHGSDSSAAPVANSTLPAATSLCSSAEDCEEVVVPVPSVVRGPQSSLDQDLVAVDVGGIELQPGSRAVLQLRYRGALAADRLGLHQSDPFVLCNGSSWSTAAAGEGNNTPGGGSSSGGGGNANNTVTSGGSLDVSNSSSCSAAVLVATQLEPLGARKLMPCYDGPRFKASFQVMLEVPSGLTALSNMPVLRRAPAPAADTAGTAVGARAGAAGGEDKPPVVPMDRVLFEPTPIMSPYLLAIAAGELRQLEGASEHGPQQPEVRMWAVPGMEPQLQVAQTAALGALAFFRDWTGIEQPVPKFDFVAIPGKGGAMENWGLLLFDEARFLVNKGTEGAYGAWLAADVVCHETAHQWFGNLVTAHDWTQLTVNEGVASFMEYKCIEAAFPYMPARPLFFRATSPSLERLGIHEGPLERARQYLGDPLLGPLVPPSDLQSVDSVVMYSKGAALLGMVEAFLEERRPGAFQAGFQAFLRQHLGGTAIMADLLAAIGQEATAATGPSNSSRGDGEPSPAPAPVYDPGAAAELVVFAQLAQQYADQHGSHMASNSTGSGSSTGDATSAVNALGAWLHALGFPYLTFMDAPGVENGSADPQAMVAAAEQHPYCSWHQLPPQLEAGLGASNFNTSAARGQVLSCPGEGGVQWWLPLSAPSASGLLAAANASDTSSGGGSGDSSDAGMEPNAGVPLWVADPWGAGLYRTAYPERYLHTLLAAIKGFKPCYRRTSDRNSTGDSSSSAGAGSNKSSSSADTCSASWTGGRGRALNFSVGSRSCGDLDAGSCELSAGPLLAAAPVLADVAALAAVGIYPASWALEAAQAAAHAEIAATGVGSYLLLLPAAEALDAMRPLAAGNSSTCLQQLDLLTAELLPPQAARILNLTQAGVPSLFLGASPNSSERQQQRSQQDAFLGQLASSPLLWRAALVGSNATAGALCSALPATPLWGHVWEAAAVAGKGGIPEGPECPYNFEATGALPDNGSTGSGRGAPGVPRSCRWAASAAEQGVPAVLRRGPDGVPPPDLLPPIYAVAAAWAPGCAQQLQALEATPGAVIEGLMHCWEQEEDGAEAERCLHALPFATTKDGALEQALDLLLDPAASSCTDASAAASSSSTGGSVPHASLLAAEVRAANRRRALRGKLANLLKNAASRSRDAWLLVLNAVQRRLNDSRTARSGLLGALCSTLEQLPAPWLAEDFAALQALVAGVQGRGSEGMQCSAAALKRVLGRAVQAQQVAASSGAELCQSLARMLPYN